MLLLGYFGLFDFLPFYSLITYNTQPKKKVRERKEKRKNRATHKSLHFSVPKSTRRLLSIIHAWESNHETFKKWEKEKSWLVAFTKNDFIAKKLCGCKHRVCGNSKIYLKKYLSPLKNFSWEWDAVLPTVHICIYEKPILENSNCNDRNL